MNTLRLLFSSFLRIWRILPNILRKRIVALFLGMLLLGVLELASIMSLSLFAAILNSPERVLNSRLLAAALERFPALAPFFTDARHVMLYAVVLPIALIMLKGIAAAVVAMRTGLLGGQVAGYVGCEIMRRFVYMPYDWHISAMSADAFTKMSWRHSLGQLLTQSLVAYSNFITAGLLFLGLFIYTPGLTMLVIVVMGLASALLYGAIRSAIDHNSATVSQAYGEEGRATMAAVRGIREILIYQQQPVFLQAISQSVQKSIRPQSFLGIAPAIPSWVLESTGFLLIGVTMGWMVLVQDASNARITSNVAMLTLTAWRVLPSLNRAVGATVNIRANQPMGLPCLEYMESLKASLPEEIPADTELIINKSIKLENVSYRYPGADDYSLRNITLEIPAGACVGFVGKSGAGKSTLINILSGLLQPTEGKLLVDGREITGPTLAAYRRKIGYVPQNPYLMPGTVAENVSFSEWGRPANEERLRKACKQAEMDFLGEDFSGLQRGIGENGAGLSGGQAQRVTIARALYPEPSVLVFDEATSSLDHATEESIQKTIHALPQGITRLIIAHRLSSLATCDIIYWLDGGKVGKQGAAQEIIGEYQDIG